MIYQCNQGDDFSAINEKAHELHKKEKHRVATPPPPKNQKKEGEPQISLGNAGRARRKTAQKSTGTHIKETTDTAPRLEFPDGFKG